MTPRDEAILQDLWHSVFATFDSELDYTGEDAGKIAQAMVDAARLVIETLRCPDSALVHRSSRWEALNDAQWRTLAVRDTAVREALYHATQPDGG